MSPTNRQVANVVKPWCKMVEDDSKGRIKFKVFPGGVLHGANDGFKAAGAANITDFTHAYPSYVPGNFHLNHGTGLPFLYPNAYVGSLVCEELYNKYLKKEYEGMGVYLMSYQVTANYQIVTKSKPVRTLEDLKGLKIRSAGGMANDFLAAVGAIPVALPAVEAYTALQTGLLDGVLTNAIDIISNRLHEITKYVTISDASTVPVATCMNKKTYNALPKDLRLLVYNSNRKYPQMMAKEYEEGVLDDVKKTGMTVINLSEQEKARWVAAAKKVEDKFIADNEAKGYPAKEFMKELHALTKKYEKWTPAQIWEQVTKNPVQGIND
ncbi:MAG: 2,3-diketo-L-gulonate-binding periplasmic protein YiaO precursor [Syntrophaceae bacterium PtaU1.Bin231]|nr:MAG: 2,3-diketo-L-gulonate-binding periplasmic protein YiaO precursor [Syntrophaceae bacterium PtaU1.Bin231]